MANRKSDVDWFMWNGVKSTDYGIHVLNQPSFASPKERYTNVTIPGRSGSLIVTEGDNVYDNISLTVGCVVDDIFLQTHAYDIYGYVSGQGFSTKDIIRTYLNGTGKLTFPQMHANDIPGQYVRRDYYRARLSNQIEFSTVAARNPHKTFDLIFDCEPYIYLEWGDVGQDLMTFDGHGIVFKNEGNVPAKPLINVVSNGSSIVLRTYNETFSTCTGTMSIGALASGASIWIDCDSKIAYDSSTPANLMTGYISGDWLEIGLNSIPFVQTGTSISTTVYPRFRRI